jgi:hypothetical protein
MEVQPIEESVYQEDYQSIGCIDWFYYNLVLSKPIEYHSK